MSEEKESSLYNPLDKRNLGLSVAEALLNRPLVESPLSKFLGAGVYALYYSGSFELYQGIDSEIPIYVGKAIPAGARKGAHGLATNMDYSLHKRLTEHFKSIEQAENLNLEDFKCRYLIVDDIWIPLGEALLIEKFRPLWNVVVDGFGNHDPGSGRYNQERSSWDTLHPGRLWALKCKPGKSVDVVEALVRKHLQQE